MIDDLRTHHIPWSQAHPVVESETAATTSRGGDARNTAARMRPNLQQAKAIKKHQRMKKQRQKRTNDKRSPLQNKKWPKIDRPLLASGNAADADVDEVEEVEGEEGSADSTAMTSSSSQHSACAWTRASWVALPNTLRM